MKTVYEKMIEEARRIGWPVYYQSDVTERDRARIEQARPGTSFLWLVMSGGTYIARLDRCIEIAGALYWLRQSRAYRIDIEGTLPGRHPPATGTLTALEIGEALELVKARLGMTRRTIVV